MLKCEETIENVLEEKRDLCLTGAPSPERRHRGASAKIDLGVSVGAHACVRGAVL